MIKKILTTTVVLLSFYSICFSQPAGDCPLALDGCMDSVTVNGGSGFGAIEESNFGANNVSWPPTNPQGVNSGCMFANERHSTWVHFTADVTGPLEFSIGAAGTGGYYDWILWENVGGTACADILNDILPPVACNWNASSQGFTGMSQGGPPPGGIAGNFQPALNVVAGQEFILCFSNYSSNVGTMPFNAPCATVNYTICNGDTTTISLVGLPAIITSYSWSPTTNISNPNTASPDVWPTDTTTYTCTLVNPDSTWTQDIKVYVHQIPVPDAGLDDSLCHSIAFGANLAVVPGAGGDVNWTLENALTNNGGPGNTVFSNNIGLNTTATVNLPGYYEYVVYETDVTGVCPDGSDTVNVYYSEEFHTTAFTDPTCFGYADGTITVTTDNSALYGNLGAVEYSIDGGTTWQTSNVFNGLISNGGVPYDVISRDYLGCEFTSQVTLTDPAEILISLVSSDTMICQNGTATMAVTATGAPSGIYDYTWSIGGSTTNQNINTPSPAGTDFSTDVFATSDLGCVSANTVTINVTHYAPINFVLSENDSICPGNTSTPQVTSATGGKNGYDYMWSQNGVPMTDITDMITVNPTTDTDYCVTLSDVCETTPVTQCTRVIMRRVPQPMFSSDLTSGCNPTTITFSNITDPQDVDSIIWTINGNKYSDIDPLAVEFDQVGLYDVGFEVYSEYGCHDQITSVEYIEIFPLPNPVFYANPSPTTIFNTGITMNNLTEGVNNTYSWTFPGGSPASSVLESPSVYYPEGQVGDYPVTLTATSDNGCVKEITHIVYVVSDVIIYAPNVFTPDGDEYNESWRVYIDGIDIYDYHLTMYNRWGEPVWESYNQIAEWKGTYGSNELMEGTYIWKIECKEQSTDKKYEFRGHVTVLK